MKQIGQHQRRRGIWVPIVAIALSVFLFLVCYEYDNKYNTDTPQPKGGILLLDEKTLEQHPVLFLVNGWEAYNGLLTPGQLHSDPLRSHKSIYIGEYTGFHFGDTNLSPHGSATLVLNIAIPSSRRSYALELPEIYSAYRLYMNGELLCEMGDPSPDSYTARIGNRSVMFTAGDNIEIVLAMSDYSHVYSGLVYPPAFGEPEAVDRLLYTRFGIRVAVSVTALLLSVFYLAVGFYLRWRREPSNTPTLLYGLLCLCFLGYVCYPVIKTLIPGGLWWYTLENFCYCAMLLLAMLVQTRLCGLRGKLAVIFPAIGAAVCVCSLFTPAIAQGGQTAQDSWSAVISVYFILCAVYLTVTSLYGLLRGGVKSYVMLCGALVFDTALVMDRLLPDYEPIYTGWFSEWAGLVLVLCTGILIAQDVLRQYRERRALAENMDSMQRLMETQQAYYPLVLDQAEQARAARHDLRHHLAAVRSLSAEKDFSALDAYFEDLGMVAEPSPVIFCGHPIVNMLLSNFAAQAESGNIRFTAYADIPGTLAFSDPDLFAIIANLLENAMEAVRVLPENGRFIEVGIRQALGSLIITVDNPYSGQVEENNGKLLSGKRQGQPGVGTASVRRIAQRYGGTAAYHWEQTEPGGIFHAVVILPNKREDD
ncbi:ATP-binding protein [Christensenellaceae bacterium OttesenSCG-928-K19]|nr:ATP-binding protein [Christensenellaceae bacterium OttesenSCG-928-K19]